MVVETLEAADAIYRFDEGDLGSVRYGARVNMRVIHIDGDDDVAAHWVESADFEIFKE